MNRSPLSSAHASRGGRVAGDVTIRPPRPADEAALATLATLDSARPLTGDRLLAEVDGRLVAAVSTKDGRAVADPFVASAPFVEMLRVRARGRDSATSRRRLLARLMPHRASAAPA
jgi:hypothetical protein